MNARRASFAGSWYPDIREACEREINHFLNANRFEIPAGPWLGGIVPHAGWYYSGAIACNIIHALKSGTPPDVFVLFGMHLHSRSPNYIMTDGAWETPFGELTIESDIAHCLLQQFPFQVETAKSHTKDNTIELQLPFIKYIFPNVKIVPVGVPPNASSVKIGETVATVCAELGVTARIVGSTDLTHYGFNYGFIPQGTGETAVNWVRNQNDRRAIDTMLAMNAPGIIEEALSNQNACCSGAVAAAIAAGKAMGATSAVEAAYATSYDKSPGDSFVGYVGILF